MQTNYGLNIWADENFIIKDNTVNVNHKTQPSLLEITQKLRDEGYRGPMLLRFPHLIKKQISTLYTQFNRAKEEFNYQGNFHAVFPLKVNQYPNFVNSLMDVSKEFNYGLEAGSKAELVIAMTHTPLGAPITVNGFKDKEMISLCFIARAMGHNITITIEGLGELETIIQVHSEFNQENKEAIIPKIGVRIRLHSSGIGIWAKSGGYSSKFGLTSTELLEAYDLMAKHDLLEQLWMVHFHIGSQMSEINPLKKALREAGNIYADLKNRGAYALSAINIGGGLAVEYGQYPHKKEINYALSEFANDVVFLIKEIAKNKNIEEPDIFTESGRFIAASHAVLIAPVLELFSQDYQEKSLRIKEQNPPLIEELNALWKDLTRSNAREYLHDALDHMESLLTLFDLGYIDLEDRSNAEILVHLIIKKSILLLSDGSQELLKLQNKIQERYLVNFSAFQSLADFWGLKQHFPVMPIDKLDIKATNPATLWDITCDSDGEIPFDDNAPLYLHDVDIDKEEYFLAFFLTGAYQEVLGMQHNLFTHPTEVTVDFDEEGHFTLSKLIEAQHTLDVLDDIDYDKNYLNKQLKTQIQTSTLISSTQKEELLGKLYLYLNENSYLKTIIASEKESIL
ncbi:MAG: Arginine decarboxylase (EC [uncultured Sulfurovum sp.]|uniref:Arginine decarboxylase n=1 Tax=uncultured Sulfurovum sp. TaxID=269237 RepID=A0A6S6RUW5_9BACT|nr:MAG: Arginine decarboxylase (EC [uncultured Sulfurovum sp.]